MKKRILLFTATLIFSTIAIFASEFKAQSPDIPAGKKMGNNLVLNGFGCEGENISPEISWQNAPEGTKSFAVTVYDHDAPTGSGWWHWVVFNIPLKTDKLIRGAGSGKAKLPEGTIQSMTDFGKPGFGGACPPVGRKHRYTFTVYALKDNLPLDEKAPAAMVGFYIFNTKLAEAKIEANYNR